MSDETEQFILGDAAVDATAQGRRGLRRRRRKRKDERVLTHCENCGAPLTGEFCSACGQHAVDYRRSLWRVLIDAADSFLNWDTKFLASIWILLTKPWKLTNDFNAGRRARYVHPLRLYLLASILFFLIFKLIQFNPEEAIQLKPEDRAEIAAALGRLTAPDSSLPEEHRAKLEAARARIEAANGVFDEQQKEEIQAIVKAALASGMKEKFEKRERARLRAALRHLPEAPVPPLPGETPAPDGTESAPPQAGQQPDIPAPPIPAIPKVAPHHARNQPHIQFGDDDKPKNEFEKWMQDRVKNKIGEGGTKAKLFAETLRNNIPTMMLCCIPLFALVLKMLYFRRRRYYVEHLVYALHIHTFAYLGVVAITLIGMGIARFSETARVLVVVALSITMFVQVFLSIRRVYGQGWFFTTFKFLLGGIAYLVILVCAVGITAFITLLLPE
jgi:hypothetical protein